MAFVGRVILSLEIRQNIPSINAYLLKNHRRRQLSSVSFDRREDTSSNNDDDDNNNNNNNKTEARNGGQIEERKNIVPPEYRFMYPEFLPDPNPMWRNSLRERLERMDMMSRRTQIDIPVFYVGSVLAVTHSDRHAVGKSNRFVGICIHRSGCGLRSNFVLRNAIDRQGMEVKYFTYDPTIQRIECLRLEKRLDDELYYLRDAPIEYSTFPFDMRPEILPEGTPVRLNDVKVPLKPPPWHERWERKDLKGVTELKVNEKRTRKAKLHEKPWERYDLMKIYRSTIPAEEQQDIYAEVYSDLHQLELSRRKTIRKRSFVRPKKDH